jgi:hypothetical protein
MNGNHVVSLYQSTQRERSHTAIEELGSKRELTPGKKLKKIIFSQVLFYQVLST